MRAVLVFALSIVAGLGLHFAGGHSLLFGRYTPAYADPAPVCCNQPAPDLFQYNGQSLDPYNPLSAKVRQTGVVRWQYQVVSGCADGLGPVIGRAMGNIYDETGVAFVYVNDGSPVDLTIFANCGVSLYAICGQVTGVNCLGRGFPYDLDIDLNTDILTYYDQSQVAVVLHELMGHALATWNEGYCLQAGSPAGCTGQFGAVPGYVDFMNTGVDSRHYIGNSERARWGRTQGVPAPQRVGRGDGYVYFCGVSDRALYVDLYGSTSTAYRYVGTVWLKDLVKGADGCYGLGTAGYVTPFECPAIRVGNAVDWKRADYRSDRVLC